MLLEALLLTGVVAQTTEAPKDKPKLVCVYESEIGSKIPKRKCRSSEQIAKEREAGKDVLKAYQIPKVPTRGE